MEESCAIWDKCKECIYYECRETLCCYLESCNKTIDEKYIHEELTEEVARNCVYFER